MYDDDEMNIIRKTSLTGKFFLFAIFMSAAFLSRLGDFFLLRIQHQVRKNGILDTTKKQQQQ